MMTTETNSNSSNDAGQASSEISDNSSNGKPLTDQGINEKIVQKIRACIDAGKLSSTDIDSRVCEQLRSFPNDSASIDSVFDEFDNSDLTGVVNKSAFLCNLIKQWKLRNSAESKAPSQSEQPSTDGSFGDPAADADSKQLRPGPDEAKLKQILDRTGYKMEITAGQRKYGGPPPDGPEQPAHHSEVFIGKLPRDLFEDELIPLCEEVGKIWDLRLMIDPASGLNKGYGFVTYCDPGESVKAVEKLNGYAIRPGKVIKANVSVPNTRLFIGNIPKTKSKEEIQSELEKVVDGVMNVIVYAPADEVDKKNRGFCFADFDNHKNASVAKRKLSSGRVRIFNRDIAVDWADPDEEPDDTVMSQVKVLYVRNLTSEVSENDVKDLFLPYGSIERVRKVRDYAFVNFDKRDDALNAMQALNGKVLGRHPMEISLAKPMSEKRKQAQMKREQRKQYDNPSDYHPEMYNGPPPPPPGPFPTHPPPVAPPPASRPMESFNSVDNFGPFAGEGPTHSVPRGGASNRGGRGNNRRGNNRPHAVNQGGYAGNRNGGGHFHPNNNRGGFHNPHNNNNNYPPNHNYPAAGGYAAPASSQHNGRGYHANQGNPSGNRYDNRPNHTPNLFGAFNGPSSANNGSYGHPMNMPPNNFGMNSMPPSQTPYGGMKRGANPMNDGPMSKRSRPESGSWGTMSGDNRNNNFNGPSPANSGGNWYQDQGYNPSQPQSNYSWN